MIKKFRYIVVITVGIMIECFTLGYVANIYASILKRMI
jgi:hypothetical protein